MDALGSLSWGNGRRGNLTVSEERALVWAAVRSAARGELRRLARRLGLARWLGTALPTRALATDLVAPRTRLIQRAEALARELSPAWLFEHCLRTHAWARALALRDGVHPDEELLYLAALLHDLGLTPRLWPPVGECFALHGAKGALDWLRQQGVDQDRARVVAEAIALHLNLTVALDRHGPEAYLLRAGAALDVVGQRLGELHKASRDEVLAEHPRLGMKASLVELLGQQAEASPQSRIGFLCRRMGFLDRVRNAPFAE